MILETIVFITQIIFGLLPENTRGASFQLTASILKKCITLPSSIVLRVDLMTDVLDDKAPEIRKIVSVVVQEEAKFGFRIMMTWCNVLARIESKKLFL